MAAKRKVFYDVLMPKIYGIGAASTVGALFKIEH
jgi:hypothetical protein